ncbi:hypothetical protein ROZALSC1DRAFT_30426 [Rozella allomycis CSF55]|uniref:Uncharacterized protein n=1 Tax=Rozella allomycis (strain CSF55) TaxID=988480 RepID=A0A075AV52_ROZAC|nr:hypothetical protein O9G_003188 [Rozella allomycis CSF55]RKP17810.1 hypothetical protein ROZALSC1DRAFT_30426 [Rozella allomycis CSF55]|eukprot:EPZ34108.1 hypothetical protein O9G_003188 [Rozella allomycis CSF55]
MLEFSFPFKATVVYDQKNCAGRVLSAIQIPTSKNSYSLVNMCNSITETAKSYRNTTGNILELVDLNVPYFCETNKWYACSRLNECLTIKYESEFINRRIIYDVFSKKYVEQLYDPDDFECLHPLSRKILDETSESAIYVRQTPQDRAITRARALREINERIAAEGLNVERGVLGADGLYAFRGVPLYETNVEIKEEKEEIKEIKEISISNRQESEESDTSTDQVTGGHTFYME